MKSDDQLESRRWAKMMVQDHALLRQLLGRFEQAGTAAERAALFRRSLEWHKAHRDFERLWQQIEDLGPDYLELDLMAADLGGLEPGSSFWESVARKWSAGVITVMDQEEAHYACQSRLVRPMIKWPSQVLETRVSLIAEVQNVLESGSGIECRRHD